MLFSIYDVLTIFEILQIFLYKFILKWGKNEEDCESAIFFEAQNIILFWNRDLIFFSNGHICNVVPTLPNVVKIDIENDNFVLTLSNVVQFNVEIHHVVPTLLNLVNSNVDLHSVVSTLTWRCATSRLHINLKTTLNQRWNVCWVVPDHFLFFKKALY